MRSLTPIILILVSVAVFYLYINPKYEEVKVLSVKQERYQEAVDKSKQLQVLRDQLLTKYNSFSATDLARLEKFLPDNVDNVRLIMDIDGIASRYNIEIKNIKIIENLPDNSQTIDGTAESRPYNSIGLSFSFRANYDTFVVFIKDLERSLRLIDLSTIELKTSTETSANDYTVTLKTYWLK